MDRSRRHLAAHSFADADRDIDHCLRSRGAGHLGLEITARAAMESALAVPARRAFGVPLGVAILEWARPDYVRVTVGVVLVLYSAYSLARPAMKPIKHGGAAADAGVAFLNGILGGLTGLAGILTTIWCGIRGWPKDEQRAVFQPIGVAIFAMSGLWLGIGG